jgi:translation elongation factor P/translation initiation factor 5A
MPTKLNMVLVSKSTASTIQPQVQHRQFNQLVNAGRTRNFMNLNTFKKSSSCKSCRGG